MFHFRKNKFGVMPSFRMKSSFSQNQIFDKKRKSYVSFFLVLCLTPFVAHITFLTLLLSQIYDWTTSYGLFKGYLRYKTIASQNVTSQAQLKNFLFFRKVIFRFRDIQVLVFLTIPWFNKSVTSWWVLVHETVYIFEYIFWTTTHWVTKLGQPIGTSKHNNSQEPSKQFERLRLGFKSFLL